MIAIVYNVIKIKDKEKPKMTTDRIAEEIANEIVNVKNAIYDALKERDFETYEKLEELEANLKSSLENFGYIASYEYSATRDAMIICEGMTRFKITKVRSITKFK